MTSYSFSLSIFDIYELQLYLLGLGYLVVYINKDGTTIDINLSNTLTGPQQSQLLIDLNNYTNPSLPDTYYITNADNSTSVTTGALVVSGGIGASGNIYSLGMFDNGNRVLSLAGTNISVTGTTVSVVNNPTFSGIVSVSNATTSTSTTTGALVVTGGVGITGSLFGGNTVRFTNATTSTSTTTGALVVTGGVGIGGNLFVGGNLNVTGTFNASISHSSLTGLTSGDDHTQYSLLSGRTGGQVLTGGTGASNTLTLRSTSNATKGSILIDETTSSTSTTTGALVVTGGVGIGQGITIDSFVNLIPVISPTNPSSGQKLYIDSGDNLLKSSNSSGTITTYNPLTTKGDLMSHNGTTQTRTAVGIDTQIIVADSTESSGLIWRYPFGSFYTYANSLGTSTTTSTTFQTKLTTNTLTLPVGSYLITYYTNITSNQINRTFEIESRLNTTQIDLQRYTLSRAAQTLQYNTIYQYTVSSPEILTLDIRYRVVETTQTLSISNTKIIFYRVTQ